MIIQIYEIQTPNEAEILIELGVDHIGSVVLSEQEWKVSSIKDTIETVRGTTSRSSLILLFSDMESIFRAVDYYQPDIIHFCEAVDLQNTGSLIRLQENVKMRFPEISIMRSIPIIKTGAKFSIPSIDIAKKFEPTSDYFLTDTLISEKSSSQPVQGFIGITGQTCDWDIAARLVKSSRIPIILAGGITPENVSEGIHRVSPAGIDSCTGTNAQDAQSHPIRFKKDISKLKYLIEKVRKASR